jgi:dTDP-4-dehydrorhamnose 3,5-epimerase
MKFTKTKIEGLYLIGPEPKNDERGYFARIFCQEELKKNGLTFNVRQANRSFSEKKGTLRGMHFQKAPRAEDKIVQCLRGKIFDVAVDMRKDSKTFGQWVAEELTQDNQKMFLIPKGLAHGFQALTDQCEVLYLMSEFYSPEHASGIRWNDPFLNIIWPMENPIVSEKDKNWPWIQQ